MIFETDKNKTPQFVHIAILIKKKKNKSNINCLII